MEKKADAWTVDKLENIYGEIGFPEYQREPNVWSLDAKQRLVDSMVRRFDIAAIYVYVDEYGTVDCVDGRQRLGAIMSFLGKNPLDCDDGFRFRILNEIYQDQGHPLEDMDNKTFEEISALAGHDEIAREFIERFRHYRLTVIRLSKSETENEFNLQFARLNLGTIINSGEKLHAMVGQLRDACFGALGGHAFLEGTRVPTRRYSREQLAAQIVAQVFAWEKSEEAARREYARTRHFDLQGLFKRYTTLGFRERKWLENVEMVMDKLHAAFRDKNVLRNRAIVVSTVLLGYEVRATTDAEAEQVAAFVDEFLLCLKWQVGKGFGMDEEYRYLAEFQRHLTQASVEKTAVERRAGVFRDGLRLWKTERVLRGDGEYRKRYTARDPAAERRAAGAGAGPFVGG